MASLKVSTEEFIGKCEGFARDVFKAYDIDAFDAIKGLDSQTGMVGGAVVKLYNDAIEYALTQAEIIDEMNEKLDKLLLCHEMKK